GGDEVERIIRKRQMEGVGLDGDSIVVAELLRAACQHGVGEIGCENGPCGLGAMADQGQRHVSGAAADVENSRLRLREERPEAARGATHQSRSMLQESTWFSRS